MLYFIKGQIVSAEEGRIVLENNGIGYDVMVSSNTLGQFNKTGEFVTLYTVLRISENDDTPRLYGFYGIEEKAMFLKLTSISGVGPKTAIQILSEIDPKTLALNIVNSDSKALAKVKGIGKKTAMRIIIELKEKLEEEDLDSMSTTPIKAPQDQISQDSVMVLVSLGMSKSEAIKKVQEVRAMASSVDEIFKLVMQGMKK